MIHLPSMNREVSGIPTDAFTHLYTEFHNLAKVEDFSNHEVRSLVPNNYGSRIALLSVGNLIRFFRTNKLIVDQSQMDDLSDYLEDSLPDRFDDPILQPMLPGSIKMLSGRKRALLVGNCVELSDERALIRETVSSFFKIGSNPDSWPSNPPQDGYEFAFTSHRHSDDVIELASRALTNIPLFCEMQATYEPIDMRMTPIEETQLVYA